MQVMQPCILKVLPIIFHLFLKVTYFVYVAWLGDTNHIALFCKILHSNNPFQHSVQYPFDLYSVATGIRYIILQTLEPPTSQPRNSELSTRAKKTTYSPRK